MDKPNVMNENNEVTDITAKSPNSALTAPDAPDTNVSNLESFTQENIDVVMSETATTTTTTATSTIETERCCWICFETDKENKVDEWVQPCKCRGTTKWVHEKCLFHWIDVSQQNNVIGNIKLCPQCKTAYILLYPETNTFINALTAMDILANILSEFFMRGFVVASIYWTVVTYGMISLIQFVGYKKAFTLLSSYAHLSWILLPIIPVGLILCRLIRWDDAIFRLIHNRQHILHRLPFINWFFQRNVTAYMWDNVPTERRTSSARVICGALILPSMSSLIGRFLFGSIENIFFRTALGGLTFVTVKGILKIYLKHQQYIRMRTRRVIDYTAQNIRRYFYLNYRIPTEDGARNNRAAR